MGKGEAFTLDTVETEERSEVLRGLQGVSGEWMALWLDQWGF